MRSVCATDGRQLRAAGLALIAVVSCAGAAQGQAGNPWTPQTAPQPPVYAGDAATLPAPGATWSGGQAPSLYAPPDLDARLSGAVTTTPQPVPQPMPQAQPGLQAPVAAQPAPQVAMPGTVTPVIPGVSSFPGALPYGAAPVTGVAPVAPGYGYGYGSAAPYGYAPGYGAGWPGYAPGWGNSGLPGTGWSGGWPGMGFSPFGFW